MFIVTTLRTGFRYAIVVYIEQNTDTWEQLTFPSPFFLNFFFIFLVYIMFPIYVILLHTLHDDFMQLTAQSTGKIRIIFNLWLTNTDNYRNSCAICIRELFRCSVYGIHSIWNPILFSPSNNPGDIHCAKLTKFIKAANIEFS